MYAEEICLEERLGFFRRGVFDRPYHPETCIVDEHAEPITQLLNCAESLICLLSVSGKKAFVAAISRRWEEPDARENDLER